MLPRTSTSGYRRPAFSRPDENDMPTRRVHRTRGRLPPESAIRPARFEYWINEATVWLQRGIEADQRGAVAHDVHERQMISKQSGDGNP
jgi:hypothetical protein